MKKTFLNWIFKNNKDHFMHLIADDMIGVIPKRTEEPAFEVVSRYKDVLMEWLTYMAWNIQKSLVVDPTRSKELQGTLVFIKVLMSKVQKTKGRLIEPDVEIVEDKSMESVAKFVKGRQEETA